MELRCVGMSGTARSWGEIPRGNRSLVYRSGLTDSEDEYELEYEYDSRTKTIVRGRENRFSSTRFSSLAIVPQSSSSSSSPLSSISANAWRDYTIRDKIPFIRSGTR
jgi:hypothetical protein